MNGIYSAAVGCAFRVYAAGSLSSEIEAHSSPRKFEEAVVLDAELIDRVDLEVAVLPWNGMVVEPALAAGVGTRRVEVSFTYVVRDVASRRSRLRLSLRALT